MTRDLWLLAVKHTLWLYALMFISTWHVLSLLRILVPTVIYKAKIRAFYIYIARLCYTVCYEKYCY